jgi:RNA polymerase sigma-70 factor (TIGR02960 family)
VSANLIARARNGDHDAFAQLVDPHRRELEVHCYRMLGSHQDAEDALQETLVAAWQGMSGFEERASLRTWLYRIATNRCLNARRSAKRRPQVSPPPLDVEPPEPTRFGELVWLEPYPDVLLDGMSDSAQGPEARYDSREAMSLAFITALQHLPARQRAVLILRDVLGYPARDVADMLEATEESVTSALKRARSTIGRVSELDAEPAPAPGSELERNVLEALVAAFESSDVDGLVALLTEDVWMTMPPVPLEYQGRDLCRRFMSIVAFRPDRSFRMIATRANSQPAFGIYLIDSATGVAHANGLLVVTLAGDLISAITRFDTSVFPRFGLPRTLDT